MKKKNLKWQVQFYMITLGVPLLLIAAVLFLPPQFDETYPGELPYKMEWLRETGDHRIIVVGGSSVAFGLRSDLIEQEFERNVVNFGLYAPLGSKTMLEACFSEIREGDTIIFSPEQNSETLSFSFQPKEVWEAMDGHFSMIGIFEEEELKRLIGVFPEFACDKLKYALTGKPQPDGIYRRDSFNAYGDIAAAGREANRMPEQYDPTMMIDFTEFPEDDFLEYLNEYAERVRKKGAEFYYRFCPMNELAVVDETELDSYVSELRNRVCFKILGNPHECILDSRWFYDTNFHLNDSGAVVNTYYLVRDLKAEWKDSSKTEIGLPEMPEAWKEVESDQSEENKTGCDNSQDYDGTKNTEADPDRDAEYFIYEEQEDSLSVAGVSEAGRMKKELSIPQACGGKKVTEVLAGSFADCAELEEITVNAGIALHDGCFAGCRTLKRIILNAGPGGIMVGTDLLAGTDALLYTKDRDAYALDYSWGIYSDKIKSIENRTE